MICFDFMISKFQGYQHYSKHSAREMTLVFSDTMHEKFVAKIKRDRGSLPGFLHFMLIDI